MEHAFVHMAEIAKSAKGLNPRAPWNTRLYRDFCIPGPEWVSIHVLMEHAFVPLCPRLRCCTSSQSTCSWNKRLYKNLTIRNDNMSLNPRAHGTRVCTPTSAISRPSTSQSTCSWNTRLYVDVSPFAAILESQSTCSWNTRLYTLMVWEIQAMSLNPRAHGTRVCTITSA